MGVISGGNPNNFKPASHIYSKVLRFLSSFNAASIIDEGEFPTYAKEVLKTLQTGAYMESQALIELKDGKAALPEDFEYLYSAYKCSRKNTGGSKGRRLHQQPTGFGFMIDITDSYYESKGDCVIDCCEENTRMLEKINVKHYIIEDNDPECIEFDNVTPLRLSPNVMRDVCMGECGAFLHSSCYEINITNRTIYANFDGHVYIKYYAFPIDEEGEILIPEVEATEQAVYWYIIYNILLAGWFNSSIPDIQNKAQYAEQQYLKYKAEAKYINKLPTFADTVNMIRTKKGLNKLTYFTGQFSNTNFQRSR